MIYEILFQNFRRWSLNVVDLFIFPNGFWLPGRVVQWYQQPTHTERALHQAGPDCERNMRIFMTHL